VRRMSLPAARRPVVIVAVSLLASASTVGLAVPAEAAAPSIEVSYVGSTGDLFTYQTGSGAIADSLFAPVAGTSPSASGGQIAAVGTYSKLYIYPWPAANSGDGAEGVLFDDTTIPVALGTSPSVTYDSAGLPDAPAECNNSTYCTTGLYADAFSSGWSTTPNQLEITFNNPNPPAMGSYTTTSADVLAAGTSPAIASDTFSYEAGESSTHEVEAAFTGTNGDLKTWMTGSITVNGSTASTGGTTDTGAQMASGTSPALTADNYDVTTASFAAAYSMKATGDLAIYYSSMDGSYDSGVVMAAGTSPAIASDGSAVAYNDTLNPAAHVEAAFHGTNGDLFYAFDPSPYAPLTHVDTGLAMAPGTNPAITYDGSEYQIAFQGLNGHLWLYNTATASATDTGIVMAAGSSPAIG
jgi:hypothetical protein